MAGMVKSPVPRCVSKLLHMQLLWRWKDWFRIAHIRVSWGNNKLLFRWQHSPWWEADWPHSDHENFGSRIDKLGKRFEEITWRYFVPFQLTFLHKQGSRDMVVELLQATRRWERFSCCVCISRWLFLMCFIGNIISALQRHAKTQQKWQKSSWALGLTSLMKLGVAWLEIYVKVKLSGDCEEQRHVIKKSMCFNKDLNGKFTLQRVYQLDFF